jgi:hypothetical protein
VAGRSLLVGVEGGSRGVRMSACNNGLVEAFIVVRYVTVSSRCGTAGLYGAQYLKERCSMVAS